MTATALTLAAFMTLAARPECGAGAGVPAARLAAVAQQESGFDPLVISINVGGRTAETHRFASEAEATAFARDLDARGVDYDAGLMQINRRQFDRHHLTIATVFNACANLRAGAEHLAEDRMAWEMASRRYNTGTFNGGSAYARAVDVAERVISQSIAATDHATPPPAPHDSMTDKQKAQQPPPEDANLLSRKAPHHRKQLLHIVPQQQ